MTLRLLDEFCGTPFWDWQFIRNATIPDLTPCFQTTVLTWVPCTFLWLFAPMEFCFQRKSTAKPLPWTGILIARTILAVSLALLSAIKALNEVFYRKFEVMFTAFITASCLKFLTFALSIVLIMLNKVYGRHTSGILFIFWFSFTLCEIVSYRSAILQIQNEIWAPNNASIIIHMIYFPLMAMEFLLSCFADTRPKPTEPPVGKVERKESPEMSASFISKLLFTWFDGMAVLGWRRPLTDNDLWELNPQDRTRCVAAEFFKYLNPKGWIYKSRKRDYDVNLVEESNARNMKTGSRHQEQPKTEMHIAKSLTKTFWIYFISGGFRKLLYDLMQFVNPMLLKLVIDYVKTSDPIWMGILYAAAMFCSGTLQSILLGNYFRHMFILGMRVRSALVASIYEKSLVMSSSARNESTLGEIVNLMSVDSQRFMDLLPYLNLLWSAPLQILIATLLLWKILGPSVLAGLFVMITLMPLNALIASFIKRKQTKQMKWKDERVKLVNEVLSGIKVLKLYAWEEAFSKKINEIRLKEIEHLKRIAYLNSFSTMLWNCSPFLVALSSFATYVLVSERHILDASTAFVSLSLFNILRFPLVMLPHLITTMVMVSVSIKRIDKYLNSDELEGYVIQNAAQEFPVTVCDGYFAWSKGKGKDQSDMNPILKNINLKIKSCTLVAVVGEVGAGKSSLLSAILGDMVKLSGTVSLNGKTAFVSQEPWVQNCTLQKNILFYKSLHKKTYNDVIEACELIPDLAILPGGDQTEIGEKGINLSGGQKQRVSLARAVYSAADIYLLDDPLSAVDSHVGKKIFEKVIGPNGLLKNKTRILVTHGLMHLPETDLIYVMVDGTVTESGSFKELIENKGSFAEFLSKYLIHEASPEELQIIEDIAPINSELLRSLSEKICDDSQGSDQSTNYGQNKWASVVSSSKTVSETLSSFSESDEKSTSHTEFTLIDSEIAETGQVKCSVYLQYMKAVGYFWVLIILLAFTTWQAFSVGTNVWLSEWGEDKPINGSQDINQRNFRLGVYGVLGFGQGLGMFIGSFVLAHGTVIASKILHEGLLINILKSPMSFFDTTPVGRVVNRFAMDIDTIDVTIPTTVKSWLSCLLQVIATLVVISVETPIFLIAVLCVMVLYYFIQSFYIPTSRQLKRMEAISRSPIYSHFSETLAGINIIRAYRAERRFCGQSNNLVDKNQVCYYPSIISNRWLAVRLDFCGNVIIFCAALLAVLHKDNMEPGKVGLSVSYALMTTATLNWMVRMSSELETNIVAVERVLEYSSLPTEAERVIDDKRTPPEWPNHGEIQIENFSVKYRKGLDFALKNVNCHIKAGEKVGIVGRTGAGKTSMALSLFRIMEATEGRIVIDGLTIADVGLFDLRSRITIIPQDPVLFSGTLKTNLDPFGCHSDAQLWEALEQVNLKKYISSLKDGLEYKVIERGGNLSVGQRQLVCLARALLRKSKVVVMDEATAAVDLDTDSLIQLAIQEKLSDATVLTIAHRINTVIEYDKIMVLDNGEIIEFDTPAALLKNTNSQFYRLAKDAGIL